MIDDILKQNQQFVESEQHLKYQASKRPRYKVAILACMDTRLVHMLPAALGISDGDVVMIKNAGGRITDPYGETMRALMIAVYELGVEDIMVIGHTDCGAQKITSRNMIEHMKERGISETTIAEIDLEWNLDAWLSGFESSEVATTSTLEILKNHPLIPTDVRIHGYVIDVITGELMKTD